MLRRVLVKINFLFLTRSVLMNDALDALVRKISKNVKKLLNEREHGNLFLA